MSKKPKKSPAQIAHNKKARYEYFIEETFEAGMVLEGWEVKSIRAGKVQITESYVLLKDSEAWLFGAYLNPLSTASTHIQTDPSRTRKLLLHKKQLSKLIGAVQQKGYTCVPLNLHWHKGRVKCDIGLAKGKKLHDKRATEKEKDWNRQKQRVLKDQNSS